MTDTQILLEKISALRQRLAESQKDEPAQAKGAQVTTVHHLRRKVADGRRQTDLLDTSLRPFAEIADRRTTPPRLISRSARLLTRGRQLLQALRSLTDDPLMPQNDDDPLGALFQESVHMIDVVLRMIQVFPPSPSTQIRLCTGLEATLDVVSDRLGVVTSALGRRKMVDRQVGLLAQQLKAIYHGDSLSYEPFDPLIDEIVLEADEDKPLLFFPYENAAVEQIAARHSLTVARVTARIARASEWRTRRRELVLAALVHDVGMLGIPKDVLNHDGPLDDAQRRIVERHALIGRDVIGRMRPLRRWLSEAVAAHHERHDGTGYPMGLTAERIAPLASLLTVCDLYAALCSDRPYRQGVDPRTALTDILVLADQGALARDQAQHLFQLSFYPIGSLVELDDGSVGVVIDVHSAEEDQPSPARPVVLVLFDQQGLPAAIPYRLDLAKRPQQNILRRLSPTVRRELIGKFYPELV